MKFSIVTVCWNSAEVLPKAMDSLRMQSFKDYEWIVIDGGSTDRTMDIVRSFAGTALKWISEPDHGIYDAMNKGIALARGEYLFFLNSDDVLYDDKVLEDVNSFLKNKPDTELLYGNVVNLRADGNLLRNFSHITSHNIIEDGICHQAIFAKRALFKTVGEFDQRFKINADYDWIIRVFNSGARCAYMNRRIAFFLDGGAHSLDKTYLEKERKAVRLQYIGRHRLALRLFRARIFNRLHKIIRGHKPGILRITDGRSK
ncbi:MAG: glycosyltransferase [Gammaproteobacteria bacterium]|nr:glycosyltransferase [Gammaproteobacteria bacterium]